MNVVRICFCMYARHASFGHEVLINFGKHYTILAYICTLEQIAIQAVNFVTGCSELGACCYTTPINLNFEAGSSLVYLDLNLAWLYVFIAGVECFRPACCVICVQCSQPGGVVYAWTMSSWTTSITLIDTTTITWSQQQYKPQMQVRKKLLFPFSALNSYPLPFLFSTLSPEKLYSLESCPKVWNACRWFIPAF